MDEDFDLPHEFSDKPILPPRDPLTLWDAMKDGGEDWGGRMLRMLRTLNDCCRACTMCELGRKHALHTYKNPHADRVPDMPKEYSTEFDPHVFSNMKPSKWMVVGQNPGRNECFKGEPFVGDAGKFFDEIIKIGGLSRSDFYITNAVKCYTEANNRPELIHKKRCEPFLHMEMQLLRPNLVITLGSVAFDVLCPDLKMSDWFGKVAKSKPFDVKVYPIYHPSPRNMEDRSRKKQFMKDLLRLCELIKMHRLNEAT